MLLKFTSSDMLNSSLVDVAGKETFKIVTTTEFPSASSSRLSEVQSSKEEQSPSSQKIRRTRISNRAGDVVANIVWNGRRPNITIGDENIGSVTQLFDTGSTRILPDLLSIQSRFDTEYTWTATPDSLTLLDCESDVAKGVFHQNAIKLPTSPPTSPTLLHTGIPGMGHNYLEFDLHPVADSTEIIVSFLLMEVLRRGCFLLTPYTFERPKFWQLAEAKDLLVRRFRRNTL
ncbi:hypothetical protein C8J56DRAFT_1056014 [Mycena floridula]|nr:hypothetical protein C8J56DRAFT_1056014 [Mycena floridula]